MIVDPDDFEIDYKQTVSTRYGKQIFEQLISQGNIVEFKPQDGETTYKMREKNVVNGAVTLDKYFVAVGTLDE